MRRTPFRSRLAFGLTLVASICGLLVFAQAVADAPKIDHFEVVRTNLVLIGFEKEANLNYEVQYTETIGSNGIPTGPWTNLDFVAKIPVSYHYIAADTNANNKVKQRFYRLHAFP
jgi:hypothetical protein